MVNMFCRGWVEMSNYVNAKCQIIEMIENVRKNDICILGYQLHNNKLMLKLMSNKDEIYQRDFLTHESKKYWMRHGKKKNTIIYKT